MSKIRTSYLTRDLIKAYTCEKKNIGPILRILKKRQNKIPSFLLEYISLERNGRLCVFICEIDV